jgi:hypothetical protein
LGQVLDRPRASRGGRAAISAASCRISQTKPRRRIRASVAAVRQGLRESGYTNDKADQASRNVRKPPFKLLPGGLQLQNDVSALIETNCVECILAKIDPDRGDHGGH